MAKLYISDCDNSFYTKTRIGNEFITYQIDICSDKAIEYFRKNKIKIDSELPYNWYNELKKMNAIYTKNENDNIYYLRKTKCSICFKDVYYYEKKHKSGKISKVFFDSLGPSWNIHSCTNEIQDNNILINDNISLWNFLCFGSKDKVDSFIKKLSRSAMNRGIEELNQGRPGSSIFINELIGYMQKYKKEYAQYILNFCIEYGPYILYSGIKEKKINICGEDIILKNSLHFSFSKYEKIKDCHNRYAFKEFKLPKSITSTNNNNINNILNKINNFHDYLYAGNMIFFDSNIKVNSFMKNLLKISLIRTIQKAKEKSYLSEYANTIIMQSLKWRGAIFAQDIRKYYLNNGPFIIAEKDKILTLNGKRIELEHHFAVQFSCKKYKNYFSSH